MSYGQFAYVYDQLMRDVDYDSWITYVTKITSNNNVRKINRVLDLACGTGEISLRLAKKGLDVVGVDLSEDMLTVAQTKAFDAGKRIDFYQHNMTEVSGFSPFDLIVIFCDSLNYLQEEEEVVKTFQNVYSLLPPGGVFMFDVHSVFKMDHVFMDGPFVSNEEDISFIWNCFEGPFLHSVEHELSFFVRNEHNEEYRRFDEQHIQRTFPIKQYRKWLEEIGFKIIEISADFGLPVSDISQRIFFTLKK